MTVNYQSNSQLELLELGEDGRVLHQGTRSAQRIMGGSGQEKGKNAVLSGGGSRSGRLALLQQGLFGPCANGHDFRCVAGECLGVTEAGNSRGTA